MEAKQFYNKTISPLVTKSFACKWSDDNRLAIVTEKGVHVFNLIPSPTQVTPILKITRTFINSPEALPGETYMKDVLDGIFDWPRQEVFSFLMQDAFTPIFPKVAKMVPQITDICWSPKNLVHSQRCLLTVITTAGAIELVVQVNNVWLSVCQLTKIWTEIIDKDFRDSTKDQKLNSEILKAQLQRLLVTTVTWSCMFEGSAASCFAYLVTAHRNSEVVIWKVNKLMSCTVDESTSLDVELKLKIKITSENIRINTLLWVKLDERNHLLIIGFYNGQIGILKLQELEGAITSDSYSLCYHDIDSIPVDSMFVLQQNHQSLDIVAVKGMHLIIFVIDLQGNMLNMRFITSPGFSITGTSIIDSNMILIITQDGQICTVQKRNDKKELICQPIKSDLTKNHVQYLGLASSPNKLIFVLISSPSTVYDHLVNREPSDVHLFSLYNVSNLDPVQILYSDESFQKCWDCLELIRINGLKHNIPPKFSHNICLNLECLSIHQLRAAFHIITIDQTLKNKLYPDEIVDPPEQMNKSKIYIFLHAACNHLKFLAVQENLTEIQRLCISLLRSHLINWIDETRENAENPLQQYVEEIIKLTNHFEPVEEECNYCSEKITETGAAVCPSGHKLQRCALTSLQVTSTQYRTCYVCQEIFHPCLDSELSEVMCIYCDLPALYKNLFIHQSLLDSSKNLSKKTLVAGSNKDSKEGADG